MIIKNPRITEKAANISDNNVYTFDVYPRSNKVEIAKAIKAAYGVTPIKINVLAIPTKPVLRGAVAGVKRGGRKAYVTLKKGDKIEFI
jgi:large subunit ribosomal protein L23